MDIEITRRLFEYNIAKKLDATQIQSLDLFKRFPGGKYELDEVQSYWQGWLLSAEFFGSSATAVAAKVHALALAAIQNPNNHENLRSIVQAVLAIDIAKVISDDRHSKLTHLNDVELQSPF